MLRFGWVVLLCAIASVCLAEPPFLKTLQAHYAPLKGVAASANCVICHVAPPVRGPFGKMVEAELQKQGARQVTDAVLSAIDAMDADGDGWPNGQELHEGFLPGDPSSHPDGTPPLKPSTPGTAGGGLIPNHAFHPLVVHFPVALFIFGVFLDVVGLRRGDSALRRFALWNIGVGAIASLVAVATGLLGFFQKGLTFEGLTLWHPVAGVTASLFMLGTAWAKWKNPDASGVAYWLVAGIGVVATAVAGHLGATIVYG